VIELSKGNSKTGPAFSLPEGITCPGKKGVNQVDKTQLETRARITTRDIRIKLRAALAQQAYLKQSLQALGSPTLAYAEYGIAINLERAINCCNQILRAHNAPDVE